MQTLKAITAAISFCFVLSIPLFAQKQDTAKESQKNTIVKINLSALVFKNISVQYERKIARNISIAANVRYIPFGKLPFLSSIEKAVDDPSVPVKKAKLGAFGVTPEIRFYVGKKGAMRGFYVAPFGNYTRYKTNLPIDYSGKTGIFNGNISTITGGLLFGAQFKLGKSVYLDWWILGPNYGGAKGDLILTTPLSASEQAELADQIEELKADAPFNKIIDSYTVGSTGALIKARGPWAGLRGLGFNLGIRF
ncbi:MAG: DUF3575 domain-containing protein [Ferruginibacter sp.]|nr:DUF3575 domain-containing protein [Ferruginibacter sp.]